MSGSYKTIHFYWGNQPLSFLRFMTLYSACRMNREVTLIRRWGENPWPDLWTEKQDFSAYTGKDYSGWLGKLPGLRIEYLEDLYWMLANLKAPEMHTSDLLAWQILVTRGGTVSDMDVLYLKPVPEVDCDIGLVCFEKYPKPGYMPVSFMQGRPNRFFSDVYERALANYDPKVYESCGTAALDCAFSDIPETSKRRLPSRIVFPFAEDYRWSAYRRMMFEETMPLPPECIGIHWYAGRNQDYNNMITHENFRQYPCTITKAIKEIYEGFDR